MYSLPCHPRCLCISSVEKKWNISNIIIIHIVSFNGLQTVEDQNDSFSAASKGY